MSTTVSSRCANQRGRKIARETLDNLLAESAGRCCNPECEADLWYTLNPEKVVKLGEAAHIVAASASGPRADSLATDEGLVGTQNLILLCPTCHTLVDKAPDEHPVALLEQWKGMRRAKLDQLFGVSRYSDRHAAREAIDPILRQNRLIWKEYGPASKAASDAIVEGASLWKQFAAETIVPNNQTLLRLLERNRHLMTSAEREIETQFEMHARSFQRRHLDGEVDPLALTFPEAMNMMFDPVESTDA